MAQTCPGAALGVQGKGRSLRVCCVVASTYPLPAWHAAPLLRPCSTAHSANPVRARHCPQRPLCERATARPKRQPSCEPGQLKAMLGSTGVAAHAAVALIAPRELRAQAVEQFKDPLRSMHVSGCVWQLETKVCP